MNRLSKWLLSAKALNPIRKWAWAIIGPSVMQGIENNYGNIVYLGIPEWIEIMKLIKQIREETSLQQTNTEAFMVAKMTLATAKIDGDIAEIGVFSGGTAKLISAMKGKRSIHLFDTFYHMPQIGEMDRDYPMHLAVEQQPTLDSVRDYLKDYPNTYFYQGVFPATAGTIRDSRFSFVHIDVDLYESTLNCLEYFYSRTSRGGAVLCHDYVIFSGVHRAVDIFFADKPEIVIELPQNQCLVVKQ